MVLDDSTSAGPGNSAGGLPALRRWLGPGFRALRHRNYRLFFAGQGMSLIGTWMQRVALAWLVYDLTGSKLMLGIVGFAGQIMTFHIAPFAGVLADHAERRTLLVITQVLAMFQALLLAGLVFTGTVTTWQIIFLSGLLGVINGFDIPIRQSFVVEMLESRSDLPNAIAMNSLLVNGSRLIGPSLAGVLIAAVGAGWCFAINGATFLAVIAALLAMRTRRVERPARNGSVLRNLREGLIYAYHFAPIRAILLLLATVSLLGSMHTVLLPVFAKDIFRGGPSTLGFMMAAIGIGAMAGSVYLAMRPSIRGMGRIMAAGCAMLGVAVIGFGLSQNIWLSYCLLAVAGAGMMVQFAGSNSLLQTLVDDDKRGRVMSLYVMAFMGMGPFGSILAGWLAGLIGAPTTVILGGSCCILAGGLFATRLPILGRMAHPVYVRMGIATDPSEIARL
jgi:MFS family permease